ncbi:MAG TPA: PilW family protein [Burkholderiales bacterium]|nr:PilW family protein [Burkholderiales bacterium]
MIISRPLQRVSRSERGLSLVELMISITLGLLIVAALVTVFSNVSKSRSELERGSEQLENGRAAIEVLSEDLQLAGFYGEVNVTGTPTALPDPCSTDPLVWADAMPVHVQGFDQGAGAPTCMPASTIANTDILTLRRTKACVAGTAGCDAVVAGQAYVQASTCSTPGTPYVIGLSGTANFNLTAINCTTAAGLRRYVVNTYFLSSDNGSGVAVPTLKRLEFNGAAFTETPLVEGIERIEFEYGVDTDGNGTPDVYKASPATPEEWGNVVTIKIYALARSIDPSPGYIDTKTYTLGNDAAGLPVTAGPFNNSYRRHVFNGVVRLINPSGRRESQ